MAFSVSYIYEIVDKYSAKLNKISRATSNFEKRIGSTRASLSRMQSRLVNFQGTAATIAGVLGSAGLARIFLDFESSMNVARGTTKSTEAEFLALTERAKQLGITTKFRASEAAQGIAMLGQNGLNATQILDGAIDASLALSAATGMDLAGSADVATDVMFNFNKRAQELSRIVDQISGVTINSKFKIDDYRYALGAAGGVAGSVGVSLEDFNTTIAAMAPSFASGMRAGTSFKVFLQRLNPQSKEAEAIMKKLNISYFDTSGKMKSMGQIAKMLNKAFSGLSEKQLNYVTNTLYGTDAAIAALAIAKAGAGAFDNLSKAIDKVSAQKLAEDRMRGLTGALLRLKSAAEGVVISAFGSGFSDLLEKISDKLTGFLRKVATANPEILKFSAIIGGLMIAALPVTMAIGMLAGAIAGFLLPIGLAIAGVTGFIATVATLYSKNAKIKESVDNLFKSFGDLGKTLSDSGKAFSQWADDVSGGPGALIDAMASGLDTISKLVKGLEFDLRLMVFLLYKAGILQQKVIKAAPNVKTFAIGAEGAATEIKKQAYVAPIMGQSASGQLLKRQTEAMRMNGQINVSVEPGLRINSATMNTDMPGNLGFNLR